MTNKLNNILEEYDKLNTQEDISKSVDEPKEENTVEDTEEQVAETQEVENQEPEKVTEKEAEETQEQQESLESEDAVKVEDEEVEKSAKKEEDKKDDKSKDKEDKEEDDDEEENEEEDKKEKTSKSISDEDIVNGFKTVLKSFQDLNEEKKQFVTKSDLEDVTKSIAELSTKLDDLSKEEVNKSVEEPKEDVVEKSVTTTTQEKEPEGFVSKSVDTEEATQEQEAEEAPVEETFTGLTPEERTKFMDTYKSKAEDRRTSRNELTHAYQAYLNVSNNPEHASEADLKVVRDFAQL